MRHARRHLRWEQAAFRAVADRRSRQASSVNSASERMISAVVTYETIRQRGLDLLMEGEIRPSVKDVLAATSALQEIDDEDSAAISPALFYSQLDRIIQAIREEIPEERWEAVLARLDVDSADPPAQQEPDPVWRNSWLKRVNPCDQAHSSAHPRPGPVRWRVMNRRGLSAGGIPRRSRRGRSWSAEEEARHHPHH
jgi:hypothetical protein